MKFLVLALAFSFSATASTLTYDCHLTTERDQKISFELNSKKMKLFDQYRIVSTKPFKKQVGYAILVNKGVFGGKGKMKDRFYYDVDYDQSEVVSETTEHFYVEPELVEGGKVMKNGRMGGFISFEGHGFSYESYVCYLR